MSNKLTDKLRKKRNKKQEIRLSKKQLHICYLYYIYANMYTNIASHKNVTRK